MKPDFSWEAFQDAVAAVCHGSASEDQVRSLNGWLRSHPAARDEYILSLELHSRLASEPDLFAGMTKNRAAAPQERLEALPARRPRRVMWAIAIAACIALLAGGWWAAQVSSPHERKGATSKAVAMLNRVVDVDWNHREPPPRSGAPLEPGWLRLKSGLVQIVFYSGARVVLEGPAELQLISPSEAVCQSGRLVAEVPPQAKGFQVRTPQMNVTDLGTLFGVEATPRRTELHVFKGSVEFQSSSLTETRSLLEGQAAIADDSREPRLIPASPDGFATLFDLQNKSSVAGVLRHEQWRAASSRLDEDSSLLVHFDFEQAELSDWQLPNASQRTQATSDATIVGCQWTEGRWPYKRALEFRGVSDRVRLSVPGEYDALTLIAWVRVQGLDRQINSLFMSDGFDAGTVHWCIRHDGVLGLTAIGSEPGRYQICASPPQLTLDQFGLWMHLAVVINGGAKQVAHYLNGVQVSDHALNIKPPFRVGEAEIGNWNALGFPKSDPFMIRNFSGAMDEFCLFSRALSASEIQALFAAGKPQPDPLNHTRR